MSFLDEAIYENNENSLERQLFGGSDDENNDKKDGDDDGDGNKEKVEAKVAKRRKISTQPRLNPEKLMSDRGIKAIPEAFKDIKFKGKGRESEDLDLIMSKLGHWAHRLFPKFNFDDCILKIEDQGKKKGLSSYMRNFRQGMLDDDVVVQQSDDDEDNNQMPIDMERDEMDEMLSEEISKTKTAENRTFDDLGVHTLDSTIDSVMIPPPRASSTLTEEQQKRIEENKKAAMERLKQRQAQQTEYDSIDMNDLIPKPTLSDEQKQMIEENKRKAMERLKLRQQKLQQETATEKNTEESEKMQTDEEPVSTPSKTISFHEVEEMEPLVYDSD